MFDLVCVGETLIDLVTTSASVSLDEADIFRALVGGAPTNVALTAGRLGASCAMVSSVGDDALGQRVRISLETAGVEALLSVAAEHATSAAVVVKSDDTPSFVILRGADAQLESVPEAMFSTRWIHTSAFALSREPQRTTIADAVRRAAAAEITLSLDANYHRRIWHQDPAPVLPDLIPLFDVIKVSTDDCERMFGPAEPADHLASLRNWGAKAILLTQGGDPVIYATETQLFETPVPKRNVVDVTGAGDALIAGFILATLDGLPIARALAVGVATAGQKVEVLGHIAASPDRSALYETLAPT